MNPVLRFVLGVLGMLVTCAALAYALDHITFRMLLAAPLAATGIGVAVASWEV